MNDNTNAMGNAESRETEQSVDTICPVCGGSLTSEKCKIVCRSERCRYRIVMTCAEF
jgi:hypothetical protein